MENERVLCRVVQASPTSWAFLSEGSSYGKISNASIDMSVTYHQDNTHHTMEARCD